MRQASAGSDSVAATVGLELQGTVTLRTHCSIKHCMVVSSILLAGDICQHTSSAAEIVATVLLTTALTESPELLSS